MAGAKGPLPDNLELDGFCRLLGLGGARFCGYAGRRRAVIRPHRSHPLWFAFLLHRISGLGLALFLPVHFYMLFLHTAPERLDGLLRFTDLTIVKLAEFGLVFLLAVHLFGGLRLMALEFLP